MKKTIALLMVCGLTTLTTNSAHGGDREWATVGKVLTGVAAAAIITDAFLDTQVVYAHPAPVVTYRPAPRVVAVAPPPPVTVCAPTAPQVIVAPAPRPRFYRPRTVIVEHPAVVVRETRGGHGRYQARDYRHGNRGRGYRERGRR